VLEAERHRVILKLLQERSVVSVTELVDLLDSSEATVRRDINALAEAGQIHRVRGGAESLAPRHETHLVGMPFEMSRGIGAPQKRAIARVAAGLIADGESVIINGGSTTFALAEFLQDRSLDILTNSLPMITTLAGGTRNRVVIPGGTIYREQNIVLSPFENDATEHFWGQKLFMSCYGLNRSGLMEADPLIVQAEMKLLRRADEIIVLADSTKLRQRSSMIVMPLERISTLVTDDGARAEELDVLRSAGIRIVIAPLQDDDRALQAAESAQA